jgi:hypothetical protein
MYKRDYNSSDSLFKNIKHNPAASELRNNLIEAVNLAKSIKCVTTPENYFKQFYKLLIKSELQLKGESIPSSPATISIKEYLSKAECNLTFELFRRILSNLKSKHVFSREKLIKIDEIQENDVLTIKCPSAFASYHFLTAVVSADGSDVTIYQSFGYNKSLHKKVMRLDRFKELLSLIVSLEKATTNTSKLDDIDTDITAKDGIKQIETELYSLNYERKLAEELEIINRKSGSESEVKLYSDSDSDSNSVNSNKSNIDITENDYLDDALKKYKNRDGFYILAYNFIGPNCDSGSDKASGTKKKTKKRKTSKKHKTRTHRHKK